MATIAPYVLIKDSIVETKEANLSIASSAVLYGLSVYSVFLGSVVSGECLGFRIPEHLERLRQSARMIGLNGADEILIDDIVIKKIKRLVDKNKPQTDHFFRVTIHATELIPGVRTKDLALTLSIFMYEASRILPPNNTRLKTSLWRRTADTAIPARAKVNGAYVNSALAKQDAIDSGFDDCLFLNQNGYVSELSAANVFMVKRGELITPDCASDILEGITRRTIIELAKADNIPVCERKVALTELYTADEVFACGTSAFISSISEIDNRKIHQSNTAPITNKMRDFVRAVQYKPNNWTTKLN